MDAQLPPDATERPASDGALPLQVATLDSVGRIVAVNLAWRRFACAELRSPDGGVGVNYIERCRTILRSADRTALVRQLRELLSGTREECSAHLEPAAMDPPRNCEMHAWRLAPGAPEHVVVAHADATLAIHSPVTMRGVSGPASAPLSYTPADRECDRRRIAALTPREREILLLVCRGESTTCIAYRLGISLRTVDKHREHILAKTAARSWAELIAVCVRLGLLGEPGIGGGGG